MSSPLKGPDGQGPHLNVLGTEESYAFPSEIRLSQTDYSSCVRLPLFLSPFEALLSCWR